MSDKLLFGRQDHCASETSHMFSESMVSSLVLVKECGPLRNRRLGEVILRNTYPNQT